MFPASNPQADTSALLAAKPLQQTDPIEMLARVQAIRAGQQNMLRTQQEIANSQQTNQLNALNLSQAQRGQADTLATNAAISANQTKDPATGQVIGVDSDKVYSSLLPDHPAAAANYMAGVNASKKAAQETKNLQLDSQVKQLQVQNNQLANTKGQIELHAQFTNPVVTAARGYNDGTVIRKDQQPGDPDYVKLTDPISLDNIYQSSRNDAIGAGMVDPNAKPGDPKYMPDTILNPDGQVNTATLQQVRVHAASGLNVLQQAEVAQKDLDFKLNLTKALREKQDNDLSTAKNVTDFIGQVFHGVTDDTQHQQALAALKNENVPANVLANIPPHYVPEVKDANGKVTALSSSAQLAQQATTAPQAATEANAAKRASQLDTRLNIAQQNADTMAARVSNIDNSLNVQKANDDIDKAKTNGEANIKALAYKRMQAVLKDSGYTPETALADASKPFAQRDTKTDTQPPGTLDKNAYAAVQAVKKIQSDAARDLQANQDSYARKIRARGGTATDYDVAPDWSTTERDAAPAPTAATPPSSKPGAPTATSTEAQIRQRGTAANLTPEQVDLLVKRSRGQGLVK